MHFQFFETVENGTLSDGRDVDVGRKDVLRRRRRPCVGVDLRLLPSQLVDVVTIDVSVIIVVVVRRDVDDVLVLVLLLVIVTGV